MSTEAQTAQPSTSVIKSAILSKSAGVDIEKSEYTNLILDDMQIVTISSEDKEFLEGFQECQFLSLNSTGLKSLDNLPKMPKLERLELNDNALDGGFDVIGLLYPGLKVLKMSNNRIKDIEIVVKLAECKGLESLDLTNNPISMPEEEKTDPPKEAPTDPTNIGENAGVPNAQVQGALDNQIISDSGKKKIEEYTSKVRLLLPTLEILDGFNKEGQEIVSDEDETEPNDEDDDEDDFLDEEGEEDMDDGYGDEQPAEGAKDDDADPDTTKATGNPSDVEMPPEKRQKVTDDGEEKQNSGAGTTVSANTEQDGQQITST